MAGDSTFRLALIFGLAGVLPMVAYFRIRSQIGGGPLDRRQEGLFILLTLRPAALVLVLTVGAYLIDPSWVRWAAVPLPDWLRWSGLGLFALTGALLLWTLRNLGRNLTDTVVTRRNHTLVTTGPYRWVRHPFYDSALMLVVSCALLTANWFILLSGIAVFVFMAIRVRIEEQKLLARFGEPYRRYVAQTGRFLPRLGRPTGAR